MKKAYGWYSEKQRRNNKKAYEYRVKSSDGDQSLYVVTEIKLTDSKSSYDDAKLVFVSLDVEAECCSILNSGFYGQW